jgi:hypothetical protein
MLARAEGSNPRLSDSKTVAPAGIGHERTYKASPMRANFTDSSLAGVWTLNYINPWEADRERDNCLLLQMQVMRLAFRRG